MSKSPNLRARKQAATHEALYQAALRLFHARGFELTTVDEIAAEAAVSRRTFFRYFDSKESVVFAKQPELIESFLGSVRRVEERGERDGFRVVRDAVLGVLAEFGKNREESIVVDAIISASPALRAADVVRDLEWEGHVARVLAQGRTDEASERDARVLAGAIVGMLRAVTREWRRRDVEPDLSEMVRSGFALLEYGVERQQASWDLEDELERSHA